MNYLAAILCKLLPLSVLAFMFISCDSILTSAEASRPLRVICSSRSQEYGDYNMQMEYLKVNEKSAHDYAIKIDDNIIKVFHKKYEQMWEEDTVALKNRKDGVYTFISTSPEVLNEALVFEMPTIWVYDKDSKLLTYLGRRRYYQDGKEKSICKAVLFHLDQ